MASLFVLSNPLYNRGMITPESAQTAVSTERLTIVETETAVFVAYATNPNDWVARFEKTTTFPARTWAERMVARYDERHLETNP